MTGLIFAAAYLVGLTGFLTLWHRMKSLEKHGRQGRRGPAEVAVFARREQAPERKARDRARSPAA